MTGLGPARTIARTALQPSTYRFHLRRPGAEVVPLGPHRNLPTALVKVPDQLDAQMSRQGTFCRVSSLAQTDETGHRFQFSIKFTSLPFKGSPASKVEQVMAVVIEVLREAVPGYVISAEATPLSAGQELSSAEANALSTCMDGLKITLEFGRSAGR